jgi:ABC-2 type transport system permease protein
VVEDPNVRTILHIIRKEFLQIRRDRRMLPIIFVAPIIQLVILGYAANLDVRDIPTIVCDMDRSSDSRMLVEKFVNSGYFDTQSFVTDIRDIDRFIDNGSAQIAIVIPRGFSDDLKAGRSASLQVIADGSDALLGTQGLSHATSIVANQSVSIALKRISGTGLEKLAASGVSQRLRIWYNPELKSKNFMVPGILGLLLMLTTMVLTSLAIVKEKEIGTIEQLVVTPIKPYQLIIGKLMPFTIIGIVDIVLILTVASFWFNIPVKGSIALLFVLCIVFLLTTLGLGLLVSTVSKTQQQAMITSVFFVMMPMIFLSGFTFPIENMPDVIQWYTYLLPLRYFFVIVRGIFLKGVGFAELWPQALALFVFGVAILSLAVSRFQKKLG